MENYPPYIYYTAVSRHSAVCQRSCQRAKGKPLPINWMLHDLHQSLHKWGLNTSATKLRNTEATTPIQSAANVCRYYLRVDISLYTTERLNVTCPRGGYSKALR